MNSLFSRARRPLRMRMCGSSKAVALRMFSRLTAAAAKRAVLASKRAVSRPPASPSQAKAAKSRKRPCRVLRRSALVVCGRIRPLTRPVQRMPRLISSTRQSASMKASSG
ncbi:hypothetical protein D3C84_909880 [compost metagenome]